jgi:hypothetical protein
MSFIVSDEIEKTRSSGLLDADSVYTKRICIIGIHILHGDCGDTNDPAGLYHHHEMGLKSFGGNK